MNIINFENYVSNSILERGYDYYLDNLVIDLTEVNLLTFTAIVEGAEDYELIVE